MTKRCWPQLLCEQCAAGSRCVENFFFWIAASLLITSIQMSTIFFQLYKYFYILSSCDIQSSLFFLLRLNRPEHFPLFFSPMSHYHTLIVFEWTQSHHSVLTFALTLSAQTDLRQVDWPPQVLPAAIQYFPFENSECRCRVTAARPTRTVMLSHQPTFHGPTHDCLSRGLTKAPLHISIWD